MTRVNADIPPTELKRAHLLAELREITMVPASLRRSLKTKSQSSVMRAIPRQFTLNAGHVTFFYDKMQFLRRRFDALVAEMIRRGYNPDRERKVAFDGLPEAFYRDWSASEFDNEVVRRRIADKIKQKPHLYKE